jgi:hypothetical protein
VLIIHGHTLKNAQNNTSQLYHIRQKAPTSRRKTAAHEEKHTFLEAFGPKKSPRLSLASLGNPAESDAGEKFSKKPKKTVALWA